MANIRLKKGQVNPNNPQATSIRGAASPTAVDISSVSIEGRHVNTAPQLIPGFKKLTREEQTYIGYTDLIKRAGFDVKADFNLGDGYSGDMLMIVSKDGKVGIATQGYGSCSYCDELESAHELIQTDYKDFSNITPEDKFEEYNQLLEEIAYGTVKNIFYGDKAELTARLEGEGHTSWWLHDESFKSQKDVMLKALDEAFS